MVKKGETRLERRIGPVWWLVIGGFIALAIGLGLQFLILEMSQSQKKDDYADLVIVAAIVTTGLFWIGAYTKR